MNRIKAFTKKTPRNRVASPKKIEVKVPRFDVKPLGWIQFTWDLAKLPPAHSDLPDHYAISPAIEADTTELRKVFSSCFMLDPIWSPAIGEVMLHVQALLDKAFDIETSVCLALRHGTRIIGATVLSLDPNVDNHIAPGPSVLIEYRNRGFGTLLLERALERLRESGLTQVRGVVRDIAPAAKFLYPKFGGIAKSVASWTPAVA